MFDRRLITNFNWPLLLTGLILAAVGMVNLYSATLSFDSHSQTTLFRAQGIWNIAGIVVLFFVASIHYRHFARWSYLIYGFTLILLLLVLLVGKKVAGHQSWIVFGPFSLQPTEWAKVGLIFGLSRHLSRSGWRQPFGVAQLIPSLLLFLVPTALVLAQGDLGSSLFFGLIFLTMVLIHGVRLPVVGTTAILCIVLVMVAYFFFLSPYQKNRIATFLNPELDKRGAGYHLVQSKIAVGSGGLTGKGYLKGETHKLKFIPERHTDFIFPVLAEEWGFAGSLLLLVLYLSLLAISLTVSLKSPDGFSFFLSIGIAALFFWHLVINLGGVLGLMPLTGVPLPFMSYGGSALVTNWLGLALLLNISMRRFMFT